MLLDMQNADEREDWSALEVSDLKNCARLGISLEGSATLLQRSTQEVAKKAQELGVVLVPASGHIPPRQ
jgi:allophanate hydrolase subunit 2